MDAGWKDEESRSEVSIQGAKEIMNYEYYHEISAHSCNSWLKNLR